MKKLEIRSIICLMLAALLAAGVILFAVRFVKNGAKWATFYGNGSLYTNGVLNSGAVYDVNGVLLASMGDGEITYNGDSEIRAATVHAVGDVRNNITTSALYVNKDKLIGYNLVNGTYKLSGKAQDIKLTLDANVCRAAYEALLKYDAGCVGVYNYKTGEIVCMVSTPSFDPEYPDEVSADDGTGIYINRFLSSRFTPGSIFKTVTAAAVIETTDDYDSFVYECTGTRVVHGEDLNCTYEHGTVDFNGALAASCNGAFSVLTENVGAENMEKYVNKLGLMTSYDISGTHNVPGSFEFPTDATLNLDWAGIGQYHDLVNPCSMMVYMGAIANGGSAAVPKLIKDGSSAEMTERMIEASTVERLQQMMKQDVIESYGEYNYPGLDIYAKTGTAEVSGQDPNGWFVGFIKNDEHPYAFVVCLENAGEALYTAAPIANDVLQAVVSR